jgi:hypothetical protein
MGLPAPQTAPSPPAGSGAAGTPRRTPPQTRPSRRPGARGVRAHGPCAGPGTSRPRTAWPRRGHGWRHTLCVRRGTRSGSRPRTIGRRQARARRGTRRRHGTWSQPRGAAARAGGARGLHCEGQKGKKGAPARACGARVQGTAAGNAHGRQRKGEGSSPCTQPPGEGLKGVPLRGAAHKGGDPAPCNPPAPTEHSPDPHLSLPASPQLCSSSAWPRSARVTSRARRWPSSSAPTSSSSARQPVIGGPAERPASSASRSDALADASCRSIREHGRPAGAAQRRGVR